MMIPSRIPSTFLVSDNTHLVAMIVPSMKHCATTFLANLESSETRFNIYGCPEEIVKLYTSEIGVATPANFVEVLVTLYCYTTVQNKRENLDDAEMSGLLIWSECKSYLQRAMSGNNGKRLRKEGGAEFTKAIVDVLFCCHIQHAMCALKFATSSKLGIGFTGMQVVSLVWSITEEAAAVVDLYDEADWVLSPKDAAKCLQFRAVTLRYVGHASMVLPAEHYITEALRLDAGKKTLEQERDSIKAW